MVTLADLAGWTPIALNLDGPAPTIDWCDFSGERFSDPFFEQTVARLTAEPRQIVRTDLDALLAFGDAPSLEPCGLIFHLSRCGSTLVSRMLSTLPGVVVVSEAGPINTLLQADPARLHHDVQVLALKLLVGSLGRVRLGDERHLALKLSSWNVRRAEVVRKAFPNAPIVWVQREPVEVLRSLLAGAPGWLRLPPRETEHLFGIPADAAASMDRATFCATALQAMLAAAAELDPAVVDYRDLPHAAADRVAPLFGIPVAPADRARMLEEARYSAKEPGRVPFDSPASGRAVSLATAELAERLLATLYARLDAARA